jgi:hypothetical protein
MINQAAKTHGSARLTDRRNDSDRVLAGPAFAIDELACESAAQVLQSLTAPNPDVAEPSAQTQLLYRICLSAICHQINWDYLALHLDQMFQRKRIDAAVLSTISARDIQASLKDYHRPERVRAPERAALLRNVGEVICNRYSGDATRLLTESASKLYGENGFMSRLDDFIAFNEDPLRKKANVLVHDIVRDGVARFSDESKIAPAIDYHIIRLYLRTGRVVPLHRSTMDMLKSDSAPRPRLVKLLRESVSEALSLTSLYAKLTIPEVNGLEWQIARDICDRTQPHCTGPQKSSAPSFLTNQGSCPNVSFCRAFSDAEWRSLREPDLKKRFY